MTEIIAGIARVARHKNKEVLTPRHHSSTVSTSVIRQCDLCKLPYTSSSVTLQPWRAVDIYALSVREGFDGAFPSMYARLFPKPSSYLMQTSRISLRAHFFDFWLARGAILVAAILNAFLINNLTIVPSWVTSCVEVALLVPLSVATAWTNTNMRKATTADHWALIHRHRRAIRLAAMLLTALISAINFEALFGVLHALLYGAKGATGQTLLIDALNIWFTNVVVFALWFWNLDQGGPALRSLKKNSQPPDFQFPQSSGEVPGYADWTPGFVDYFFVSFTNATAFSPTDTMPLSHRTKVLFIVESSASLLTVGLLAARAVNILS